MEKHCNGFAIPALLPIVFALIVISAATFIMTSKMLEVSRQVGVQTEVEQYSQASIRSAPAQFSRSLSSAMQGSGSFDVNTTLTLILNTPSSGTLFSANSIGQLTSGAGAVTLTTTSGTAANPQTDIINSLASTYSTKTMPQSRFMLGQPGVNKILAKSWSYLINTQFTANDHTSTNNSSTTFTKTSTLTIYEVPHQFAAAAYNLTVNSAISGTVLAGVATIQQNVSGRVLVNQDVNWNSGVSVAGISLPTTKANNFSLVERIKHDQGTTGSPISILESQSSMSWIRLGDYTTDSEGIPAIFKKPSNSDYNVYCHPYYQTSTRVVATGLSLSILPTFSTLTTYSSSGTGNAAARKSESAGTAGSLGTFRYTTNPFNASLGTMLVADIDVTAIPVVDGARSLFIDLTSENATNPRLTVGICLKNADAINTPISIVSANPVFLTGNFNPSNYPASILAPRVFAGFNVAPSTFSITGSIARLSSSSVSANQFTAGTGAAITPSSMTLQDVNPLNSTNLPPAYLKYWLVEIK